MRKLYIFGLIGLAAVIIGLAWADQMTFTTYYPAPYGVYNNMVVMNSLGVGTKDPGTARLAIIGGDVGIGTTEPRAKLDVAGGGLSNYYNLLPKVNSQQAVVGVFRGGADELNPDGVMRRRARLIVEGDTTTTAPSIDFRINDPSGWDRRCHLFYAPDNFWAGVPEHFGISMHGGAVLSLSPKGDLTIPGKLTQGACPDYSNITPLEFIQESINKTEHTTQDEVDALMHVIIEQDEQIKKLTEQIEALEVKIAVGVKKD